MEWLVQMRRIPITKDYENRKKKKKINSTSQTFRTPIKKVDNTLSTTIDTDITSMETSINTSSSQIETKTDINNQPVEDTYYDEIIYYDGGGVDGYGD